MLKGMKIGKVLFIWGPTAWNSFRFGVALIGTEKLMNRGLNLWLGPFQLMLCWTDAASMEAFFV